LTLRLLAIAFALIRSKPATHAAFFYTQGGMMATNNSSGIVMLARLFWMMAGPGFLLLLAVSIAHKEIGGWFTPASIAYLVVLVGVIVARRLDPQNSYGDATTTVELQRHSIGTISVGLVIWVVVNLLGNHWLSS
jgi:hypothetical protein